MVRLGWAGAVERWLGLSSMRLQNCWSLSRGLADRWERRLLAHPRIPGHSVCLSEFLWFAHPVLLILSRLPACGPHSSDFSWLAAKMSKCSSSLLTHAKYSRRVLVLVSSLTGLIAHFIAQKKGNWEFP